MRNSFAVRLSELRRQRGLSQKETADAHGVSQALLSTTKREFVNADSIFYVRPQRTLMSAATICSV